MELKMINREQYKFGCKHKQVQVTFILVIVKNDEPAKRNVYSNHMGLMCGISSRTKRKTG